MNRRKRAIYAVALLPLLLILAGCPGGVIHKVTVAQHDFRISVDAFQQTEIALHNQGIIADDVHIQIQTVIGKVALAGIDLDTALAANAPTSTLKTKLDSIVVLLDSLNNQALLGVKNENAKLALQAALLAIKGIVTQAEVLVTT